jgi:dTDP-4-dehydrorhamnose reductase
MGCTIILGASGQLGQCLKIVAEQQKFEGLLFPDEKAADILDIEKLQVLFEQNQPQYVINCAAYTAVDKAESDIDMARKINKGGPANIALLCKKYNTTFIQISTDFIFAGDKADLLLEDDEAKPISVYGLTKLEGEQVIISQIDKYFILRTSWLYSEYGNNFVKTMLCLGKEKDEIKIISDQVGTPTYAIDLAAAILDVISSQSTAYGVYHYSNEGVTSWYDFAKAVFDISGSSIKIYPIRTIEYPTPARRPKFSVMDKTKIKNNLNITIPYWRDSLIKCINILLQQ